MEHDWLVLRYAMLLFLLTSCAFLSRIPVVNSQMIPISEVMGHPVSQEEKPPSASSPSAKTEVHAKIAKQHLREKESTNQNKEDRMMRKDKPKEFQNPSRHASEEFLLEFLLEQYKLSDGKVELQLEILENLENFCHKYENARDLFTSTDALQSILLPSLNSTSGEVRNSAASILGVASQNNPIVQAKCVIESDVLHQLIHLISSDKHTRSKALFALSSLLRNFPDAQKKFIQDDGVTQIIKIGFLSETRRRTITLFWDWINERNHCTEINNHEEGSDHLHLKSDDPCDAMELLKTALENSAWCELLVDSVKNLHNLGTEDEIVVVGAVHSSLELCMSKMSSLTPYFHQLLTKYNVDPDFESTKSELETILSAMSAPTLNPHIEL